MKKFFTLMMVLLILPVTAAFAAEGPAGVEVTVKTEPPETGAKPALPAIMKFNSNDLTLKFALKYNYLEFLGNEADGETMEFEDGLISNTPLAIGLGFKFKFLSASFSFAAPLMPGIGEGEEPSVTFDTLFTFYLFENFYFDASLRYYQGFHKGNLFWYDVNDTNPLQILIAGVSSEYVVNAEHSLSSVYNLDQVQTKTNSSPILGGEFYYQTTLSEDGDLDRYAERQHMLHLGPNGGYSHTIVFGGAGFFNAMAVLGVNWAYDPKTEDSYLGWQLQPKIAFGRHNGPWSFNIVVAGNMLGSFRDYQLYDTIISGNIGFNVSRRFDMTWLVNKWTNRRSNRHAEPPEGSASE